MKESIKYNIRTIFLFAVITLLLLSFQTFLYKLFDSVVLPLLKIDEHDWLLLVFIVLGSIYSLYIVYKAVKGFRLSCFHTVLHVFALILYVYLRYQACTTNIYIFCPSNLTIGYIDIIFIIVAVSLFAPIIAFPIRYVLIIVEKAYKWSVKHDRVKRINDWTYSLFNKPKKQNSHESNDLIPDIPLKDPKEDKLGYADFSQNIANRINSIPKDSPYSLGIIAEWGVGKSTVINFIEYYLDEKRFIILRFNPRHSFKPEKIQEDFFSFLASKLKQYNSIFSSIFIDYMKSAGIIGKNNAIQIFLNMYKVWNKEGESTRINHAIKNLSKRVIVIIEDLDRLLAEEIIEVFKIIDNNAISNNIIFISAYDKEHINKILGEKYRHENSMFSDKFFNWEIHLPLISHSKIIQYITAQLHLNLSKETSYTFIVNRHSLILQDYLKTIRDAKRFLNTFIKSFIDKENVVAFEDYMLVSLIKYKYQSEYNKIFNREYIQADFFNSPNKYILKEKLEEEKEEEKIHSLEVLKNLFNKERKSDYLSINNKSSFPSYFYYYTNRVEIDKLRHLFDFYLKDSKKQLKMWDHEDKINQVLEYFNEINILTLSNSAAIYNYIDILLFILTEFNLDIRLYIRPFFLKNDSNEICKKYSIKPDDFKSEFTTKLKGEPGRYPYSLIRELIISSIDEGEENYLFTKIELQDIAKYHVKNYIANKATINQDLEIELLYESIDTLEMPDRIIRLDSEVCKLIKDYIIKRPDYYIQSFVRNGMNSSSRDWFMLACEPFWKEIFGSKEAFKLFLYNQELDRLANIQLARNFWKIYTLHNYKPIEITYEGITYEEAISDNLQSKAKEASKIEEYAGSIETIYADVNISDEEKIQKLKETLSNIENIKLYVRKRGEIKETIRHYISQLSIIPEE